ncbi:MAG TPA: MFS transporter, partial [Thermomicrobiales bacterium]|nr:MFS transporter [Thermomicrobiales bacterium]
MLTVLRQRNFGLLWTAGLISLIGDWAFYGVMPVYILDRTNSVFYSGLTWSLISLPQVIFGPLCGVFADRHNRQRIMFLGNIGQAVAMSALLIFGGTISIWFALAVIFAASLLATLISPAENALLPTLVRERDLTTANALNALNDNI